MQALLLLLVKLWTLVRNPCFSAKSSRHLLFDYSFLITFKCLFSLLSQKSFTIIFWLLLCFFEIDTSYEAQACLEPWFSDFALQACVTMPNTQGFLLLFCILLFLRSTAQFNNICINIYIYWIWAFKHIEKDLVFIYNYKISPSFIYCNYKC
jgi:hypothetical protein